MNRKQREKRYWQAYENTVQAIWQDEIQRVRITRILNTIGLLVALTIVALPSKKRTK